MTHPEKKEKQLQSLKTLTTVSSFASGATVGIAVTASLMQAPLIMGLAAGGAVVAATTGIIASRKRSRALEGEGSDLSSSPPHSGNKLGNDDTGECL